MLFSFFPDNIPILKSHQPKIRRVISSFTWLVFTSYIILHALTFIPFVTFHKMWVSCILYIIESYFLSFYDVIFHGGNIVKQNCISFRCTAPSLILTYRTYNFLPLSIEPTPVVSISHSAVISILQPMYKDLF